MRVDPITLLCCTHNIESIKDEIAGLHVLQPSISIDKLPEAVRRSRIVAHVRVQLSSAQPICSFDVGRVGVTRHSEDLKSAIQASPVLAGGRCEPGLALW